MHDPMPLLIKKKTLNFWKDSRRQRGSNQGPLGPSNLKANVLLNELGRQLKIKGLNTKYIHSTSTIHVYYILGMDS